MPIAIVPLIDGLEKRPTTWPRFGPSSRRSRRIRAHGLHGRALRVDATYGYVTRAIRLVRVQTAD
jgi:hypothetical protein